MKRVFVPILLIALFACIHAETGVRFIIDLSETIRAGIFRPDAGDRVVLRGTFNGWTGDDWKLNFRDSSATGVFNFAADDSMQFEYKFVIVLADGRNIWEDRPEPDNPDNGNRRLKAGTAARIQVQAVFALSPYSIGFRGGEVYFQPEQMLADFRQMRSILEKEHCCMYEYTGKEEFDRYLDQVGKELAEPLRVSRFYNMLSAVTAKIGCMHTAVWMPGSFWDMQPQNLWPLQVQVIQDYLVVTGTYADSLEVPPGSVLLAINGKPVHEILSELREFISADAFNPHFINWQIQKRFPMLLARSYGFPEQYRVRYALPGRKTSVERTIQPAGITAVREVVFRNFHHPKLTLNVWKQQNYALLTVPTFIYYDRLDYFRAFMDSSFTVVKNKNIGNLIIDLRGNDGGDPYCAASLFSYLIKQPQPYFAEPYSKYSSLAEPIVPAENRFDGNLFVFLDRACGSTNGHFAALLKYHKCGTIIGEPTGATYKCNGGKDGQRRLKYSGIDLFFTRGTYSAAVSGMDKHSPIYPDVPASLTYRDFLAGRDVFMEAALKMIH